MSVTIRRTRWSEGATEKEILEAAENEERKDVKELIRLLVEYFKFPESAESLAEESKNFLEKEDITPSEAAELYSKLCFFKDEDIISKMEVGNSIFMKYKIYWVNPVQEASYIFEYSESDTENEESDTVEIGE